MAKTILKWEDTNTDQVGYKVRGQATLTATPKTWPVIATLADKTARSYTMDAAATKMYYAIGAYDAKQETISSEVALALPMAYLPTDQIAPLINEITAVTGYDAGTVPTTGDMITVANMDGINSSAIPIRAKDGKTYVFSPSGKVHRIDVADDGTVTCTLLYTGGSMSIGWVIQVPDGKILVGSTGTIGGTGYRGIASYDPETNAWAIEKDVGNNITTNGSGLGIGILVGTIIYMCDLIDGSSSSTDQVAFLAYDTDAKTVTVHKNTISGASGSTGGYLVKAGGHLNWYPGSRSDGAVYRLNLSDKSIDKVTTTWPGSDYGRRQGIPHTAAGEYVLYHSENFFVMNEAGGTLTALSSLFPTVQNVAWPVGMALRLSDGGYLFVSKYGAAALWVSPKFDRAERIPGVPYGGFYLVMEINGWIIGFGTGSTSVWRFGWGNGRPKISMPDAWYASQYNGQGRAG